MRISVTQLETFQECQVKFGYRHRRRIRPNDAKESAALSVGRQVAQCLESGLLSDDPKAAAMAKAKDPRVVRCLAVMPEEVWEVGAAGVAEDKLEVELGNHTLVGMPDLWYVEHEPYYQGPHDQEGGEPVAVHVVEFKTTGDPKSKAMAKAIAYEDWGEQATRYAALLWKNYPWLRDVPFYRRHILISWHEKANLAYPGRKLLVSQRALEQSLLDMERIADDAERVFEGEPNSSLGPRGPAVGPVHHYSRTCDWCEFGPICQANLRSGDTEFVIETSYQVKEERQ